MKAKKFLELVKQNIFVRCLAIMKSKGEAYSGKEDKFGNFNRIAEKRDVSRYLVWSIYFDKHLDALDSWINGYYVDSEPIYGRILDLINYLLLLYGMIYEDLESKGVPNE